MTAKLPYMPFYGSDFYESMKVGVMDHAERGMTVELLWRQWREGALPASVEDLAKLVGVPILPDRVARCFPLCEDRLRRNGRLEQIRIEQEAVRAKKSEGGKTGRARQLSQRVPGDSPGYARGVLGQSESESESETATTPSTGAREESSWNQMTAELGELGASALEGYRRASRNPDRLLAELRAILTGVHGPGGRAPEGAQLGRALHDMSVAGVEMSPRRLRAFVQGVLDGDPPPRNGRKPEEDDTKARMAAWVARKEAERARADA